MPLQNRVLAENGAYGSIPTSAGDVAIDSVALTEVGNPVIYRDRFENGLADWTSTYWDIATDPITQNSADPPEAVEWKSANFANQLYFRSDDRPEGRSYLYLPNADNHAAAVWQALPSGNFDNRVLEFTFDCWHDEVGLLFFVTDGYNTTGPENGLDLRGGRCMMIWKDTFQVWESDVNSYLNGYFFGPTGGGAEDVAGSGQGSGLLSPSLDQFAWNTVSVTIDTTGPSVEYSVRVDDGVAATDTDTGGAIDLTRSHFGIEQHMDWDRMRVDDFTIYDWT